jgi:3D (Asp-Asp-Asp) domain-containing protein
VALGLIICLAPIKNPPEVVTEPIMSVYETVEETTTEETEYYECLGTFKLTAYCPCSECSGSWGRNTSTGATATARRTIAVDPKIIPYGSTILIDDHAYIAEDCGGAIKRNSIDIYFDSHADALEFGKQYTEVFIKRGDIQ